MNTGHWLLRENVGSCTNDSFAARMVEMLWKHNHRSTPFSLYFPNSLWIWFYHQTISLFFFKCTPQPYRNCVVQLINTIEGFPVEESIGMSGNKWPTLHTCKLWAELSPSAKVPRIFNMSRLSHTHSGDSMAAKRYSWPQRILLDQREAGMFESWKSWKSEGERHWFIDLFLIKLSQTPKDMAPRAERQAGLKCVSCNLNR